MKWFQTSLRDARFLRAYPTLNWRAIFTLQLSKLWQFSLSVLGTLDLFSSLSSVESVPAVLDSQLLAHRSVHATGLFLRATRYGVAQYYGFCELLHR
jgi:hypothetical protein